MIRNSNIRNLAAEQEYEDQGTDDWGFIQNVVAPPAPVAAPVVAPAPFNPVGFDWTQGVQNIGGTIYQPQFESVQLGHGEEGGMYGQGALQGVLRYKEGQTAPGQTYEIIDPSTGKVTGTGKFKENSKGFFGDLFSMVGDAAEDLAPLATFALGVGPLGGMLGGSIASALGIPVAASAGAAGLSAAQVAALGSAAGGAGITALQGGDLGDVLKSAVTTALPSFVLPNIPSTGTPALDTAIKAGTQAAIRGGDIENAVVGSLLNSGVGAAVGETGLDPKLVNSVIAAATSGGDPQKLFNAAVGAAGSFAGPNSQAAVGGGAETEGFFDSEEAQAVQDDIDSILARYPETTSFFPEFDQPLLTAEPEPTPISAPESMAFLEANIQEPETVQQLMREYYPELSAPVDNETAKFMRQQELAKAGESPLGGIGPNAQALPLIQLSEPAPAPTPAPAPAAANPKNTGMDMGALMAMLSAMPSGQQKPKEQYQLADVLGGLRMTPYGTYGA